jgi:hypothetical protein
VGYTIAPTHLDTMKRTTTIATTKPRMNLPTDSLQQMA